MTAKVSLKRTLSLGAMVFYGLGTIIGAGIYVLIGEIAGQAGAWTPLAFVVALRYCRFYRTLLRRVGWPLSAQRRGSGVCGTRFCQTVVGATRGLVSGTDGTGVGGDFVKGV